VNISIEPLLHAPRLTFVHAILAVAVFGLGLIQFLCPKGTIPHRVLGWSWVILMVSVSLSSFGISNRREFGPFSWIHLLSVFVLFIVPPGVLAARRHRAGRHGRIMTGIFVLGVLVTGALTVSPGRLMHEVAFGN